MNNIKTWIPIPNELVIWKGKLYRIISVDMGGKCNIKKLSTTKRITTKFLNIDISELSKPTSH